jgi:hypothetical protein
MDILRGRPVYKTCGTSIGLPLLITWYLGSAWSDGSSPGWTRTAGRVSPSSARRLSCRLRSMACRWNLANAGLPFLQVFDDGRAASVFVRCRSASVSAGCRRHRQIRDQPTNRPPHCEA